MKKLFFCICMLAVFQLNAQEFHFIPKVGLNFSDLTKVGGNTKPGVTAGMAGELKLSEAFALEPGIFYSLQGIKTDENSADNEKYTFHYLNIPILAKGYLVEGLYVFTGPQFAFNLSSTYEMERATYKNKTDVDDMIRSFSLDLVMGTGYQFPCGFLLSFQYNLGLTNILEEGYFFTKTDKENNTNFVRKTRNSVFQVNVGWRF